jgi:hypothetical protein
MTMSRERDGFRESFWKMDDVNCYARHSALWRLRTPKIETISEAFILSVNQYFGVYEYKQPYSGPGIAIYIYVL